MNDINNISSNRVESCDVVDKKVYVEIACLLLDHGADFNIKNNKQQIPIDLCNDPSLIKLLIRYHNDLNSK